jgi:non-heme chloroperoxidase
LNLFGQVLTVPTLVMHGDNDQIVPYADAGPLSAKLVKGAILKTYKGYILSRLTLIRACEYTFVK